MTENISFLKDEEVELPLPSQWRQIFIDIVESIRVGDFRLEKAPGSVERLGEDDAKRIEGNITEYGVGLVALPNETWDTSVCRWMGNYWQVLIDLYSAEEGASDLVLFAKVTEQDGAFRFQVEDVHVP
ncbi:DUF7668 domain-containing protein [Emcibacter nanhaiensis]|uniref:DUF7668 domain-containing protein n=1 Tax=Emcibacter nanhaiensis TaxID=1505037 RepID=A0A501PB44_9PROT|nr:hypothetical protein [Emcibacter nanhaiensis]TPD57619.1 hypothetical protein FIV46_16040 [Emcibacter nanhaiensis]